MGTCGSCGPARRRGENRVHVSENREHIDPTRALFAAARPRYVVVASQSARTGKRFSTWEGAQDYASRTGGIIRQL